VVCCGAAAGRLRPLTGAGQGGGLLSLLAGGGCRGLCKRAGRLPGVTPADRVMAVVVADLWPGQRRRRAVIVEPGRGEFAGGLDAAGAEGAHDVTGPLSGRSQVRPCGWHCAPAASTGYPTRRAPGAQRR